MGYLLALMIWAIVVISILLTRQGVLAMPEAISDAAQQVDGQLFLTLACVAVAFVLAQCLLGLFVFRYHRRRHGPVPYTHGNNLIEFGGAFVVAVVFIFLGITGQRVWIGLHLSDVRDDPMLIEITGEQFAWNVRYPGADGSFGQAFPRLYDATTNPVGIDPADLTGRDDITTLNRLVVPVGTTIELRMRSKDVLHSFFMPSLRIKQDTVPGLEVPLRFKANRTGTYEIACAELCGLGHYRMRGFLEIVEPAEFEAWLAGQAGVTDTD